MDPTIVAYSLTAFAGLMAVSTVALLGTWELQANAIPPFLQERGYTSQIFVNQVTDTVNRIRREMAGRTQAKIVVSGRVTPVSELASYFGLYNLVRASQQSLGLAPPRIEIEILQEQDRAHWRIRGEHAVKGWMVEFGDVPLESSQKLVDAVAYNTLAFVSPFEALAYDLVQDSWVGTYEKTISRASSLLAECEAREQRLAASWSAPAAWGAPVSWNRGIGCSLENVKLGLILRGLAHLDSGDYAKAFDDLRAADGMGPTDALATVFLGDALLQLGDEMAAQSYYDIAQKRQPDVWTRFHEFGRGLAEAGNHPRANQRFATAARLGAEGAPFLADWGDSLFAIGEFEAALEKYTQAEAAVPDTQAYTDRIEKTRQAIGQEPGATDGDRPR